MTDWKKFVAQIATLYNERKNEIDISAEFSGHCVEFQGVITEMKLDEKFASGIAISMQPENFPLANGKVLRSDYLFLNVDPERASDWKKCKVGDRVKFSARINKSPGPFPEIQLSEFEGDPEVILMIGLYECMLLSER
jgi:hypothetical protein